VKKTAGATQIATKQYGAMEQDGADESKTLVQESRVPGGIEYEP